MLRNWYDLISFEPARLCELLQEHLFQNDLFYIGGKWIFNEYKDLDNRGLNLVKHFVKDNGILYQRCEFQDKYNISIDAMKYNKITSVIQTKLNSLPKIEPCSYDLPKQCLKDLSKIKSRHVYNYYISKCYLNPSSQNKWVEYYPFLEKANWTQIYTLPSKIVKDSYLISFQFKIIHRIFNCNYKLFVWTIKQSPQCPICQHIDNLEHYFYYCESSKLFWVQVETWLKEKLLVNFNFTVLEVLLGVINIDKSLFYTINYIILHGKYFIKECKKNEKELSLYRYMYLLKDRLNIDIVLHKNQENYTAFKEKFSCLIEMVQL